MASTNYERQKRWREKHPGLAKLRRRKGYAGVVEVIEGSVGVAVEASAPKSKIEGLRALVAAESAKPPQPVVMAEIKPRVFRNDFGAVITEDQWNELQERKTAAADAGYVIDEYAQ